MSRTASMTDARGGYGRVRRDTPVAEDDAPEDIVHQQQDFEELGHPPRLTATYYPNTVGKTSRGKHNTVKPRQTQDKKRAKKKTQKSKIPPETDEEVRADQ
jgi:hypothetical protein